MNVTSPLCLSMVKPRKLVPPSFLLHRVSVPRAALSAVEPPSSRVWSSAFEVLELTVVYMVAQDPSCINLEGQSLLGASAGTGWSVGQQGCSMRQFQPPAPCPLLHPSSFPYIKPSFLALKSPSLFMFYDSSRPSVCLKPGALPCSSGLHTSAKFSPSCTDSTP